MKIDILGPYKIGKRIGRGGMGTVYEAVNTQTNEPAAIKILNPALSDEEGFRERFEIEIETLKKLRHPHIVRLYGFGEENGVIYYAMELVRGKNLEDELQNGRRFTWREVTTVGIKLSRALKLAHDFGIVHRDLKPANILITPDDEVKLTDFGIARLFGAMNLTSEGGLVGTAEYMSPEQADGKPVHFQSDLYSLGGVMFAMLSGRPPFRSKSLPEVLQMQRFAQPERVTRYASETPDALADIIARLLSKTPEDRAANAGLLGKELAAMEHGLIAKTLRHHEIQDPTQLDEGSEFSLSRSDTLPGELPEIIDPNQPTRVALDPSTKAQGRSQAISTDQTALFNDATAGGNTGNVSAARTATPSTSRFTTVEDEESRLIASRRLEERRRIFFQTSLICVLLFGIIGTAVWMSRKPSSDEVYAMVKKDADAGAIDALLKNEPLIRTFVDTNPNDSRTKTMKRILEEVELEQVARRFQRRAHQPESGESLGVVEQEYLRITQILNEDISTGYNQLRAFVDLYDDMPSMTTEQSQCIELARRQIAQLQPTIDESIPKNLKMIESRLSDAEKFRKDSPGKARQICKGIVALYGDRPWAADAVKKAEELLGKLQNIEKSATK